MSLPELIESAAATTSDVVAGVDQACLDDASPCHDWDVRGLGNHMTGFLAYSASAARKNTLSGEGERPDMTGGDWGTRYRSMADDLVAAWSEEGALEGATQFGPGELPSEYAAGITLLELVVHGWDLARASGQSVEYAPEVVAATAKVVDGAVAQGPSDFFHPPVDVSEGATPFERLLAKSGRDPAWSAG